MAVITQYELPWPPSVNHYWRSISMHGHARVVVSREGRAYRAAVARIVTESGNARVTGAVELGRILYCPDWRERDEDNTAKAIYDSLVYAGALDGDQFVCRSICEKRKSPDGIGRVSVWIVSLPDAIVRRSGAWLEGL